MNPREQTSRGGSFKAAVQATPAIALAYQPGIQALLPTDTRRLAAAEGATGSVALDEALKDRCPNDPRWDYGIGLPAGKAEQVLWLEVHHAASGETDRVLKKLQWLKGWLRNEAPALDRMPAKFIWLLSNVESNLNDRRKRQQLAEKHGLRRHQGVLNLAALAG
jgi:hypothetical protein